MKNIKKPVRNIFISPSEFKFCGNGKESELLHHNTVTRMIPV